MSSGSASKPHSTPGLDHLIERLEWMHYLGTKSFPHEAGDCELCAAESEIRDGLRSIFEQFDTLLRAAVSVRDSWLLYEADVDEAHLTNACSDLDQLIGGSPEWVAMVERLHSNPAKGPQ